MLLIADSGSTKTQWQLIDENEKNYSFKTVGFNPYFQNTADISKAIKEQLIPFLPANMLLSDLNIFYYGAGCSNEENLNIVRKALQQNFTKAHIQVDHDLIGAARALFGKQEGIVAILGTGSNSCYYNGNVIAENIYSVGFILGDEGSGAHIGKTFTQHYLNNELPKKIFEEFSQRYKLTKDDILEAVYKKPFPNRFLASFCKFIHEHIHEPFLTNLVRTCFNDFFDKHICKYSKHKEIKISCVGSIGLNFSNILKNVALQKEVVLDKIIESPIKELVSYHQQKIEA